MRYRIQIVYTLCAHNDLQCPFYSKIKNYIIMSKKYDHRRNMFKLVSLLSMKEYYLTWKDIENLKRQKQNMG